MKFALNGMLFHFDFADNTGITAGTSYWYWLVNPPDSGIKAILYPVFFNGATLDIRYIKNGIFKSSGSIYTPLETDAVSLLGKSYNPSHPNTPKARMYYQGSTLTWDESSTATYATYYAQYIAAGYTTANAAIAAQYATQLSKTMAIDGISPIKMDYTAPWIISPGDKFMAKLSNFGASTLPYNARITWAEMNI